MSRNQTLQPGSVDQANRLITDFWCGHFTKSTYYPAVDKGTLLEGLRKRVDSPKLVDQMDASLCGPACFIYVLLNTRPDLYVQLVLDLYVKGKTTLGKLQLEPSSKAGNVPPGMDAVDWIALSGMKTNYYHKDQQVAGITLPGTVEDWFAQIGFKSVADETNLFSTKEIDMLLQAQQAWNGGYSVCLLVHAEAFQFVSRDGSWLPDHWVVLSSLIQIARWDENKKALGPYVFINQQLIAELKKELAEAKSKARDIADRYERSEEPIECQHRIKFTVYSWASDTTPVQGVPQTPGEATLCYFLRHFFGYVKAKW
jgi:hypothetical protein